MTEQGSPAVERVRSLAETVVTRHGAELVELEVKRGRTQLVRLVVDREDGIDLDSCARVSEELSRLLDADDPIPGRYTLEVSSPGADRPLRGERDFRRNAGRQVRVLTRDGQIEGSIESVEEGRVRIAAGGEPVWLEIGEIVKAKIILPW